MKYTVTKSKAGWYLTSDSRQGATGEIRFYWHNAAIEHAYDLGATQVTVDYGGGLQRIFSRTAIETFVLAHGDPQPDVLAPADRT